MRLLIIPNPDVFDSLIESYYFSNESSFTPSEGRKLFYCVYEKYAPFFDKIVICTPVALDLINYGIAKDRFPKLAIFHFPDLIDIGSIILHTLQEFQGNLITSITVNFSNTFINDLSDAYLSVDCVAYSERLSIYNPVSISNSLNSPDVQTSFICDNRSYTMIGFFNFLDQSLVIELLSNQLANRITSNDSFYDMIKSYEFIKDVHVIKTRIRHTFLRNIYNQNLHHVNSRNFNSISIDSKRGILTKSSTDHDKLINEIRWYLELPLDLQWLIPKVFKYSLDSSSPSISMEYYSYNTLHDMFLIGNQDLSVWRRIIESLFDIQTCFKNHKLILPSEEMSCVLDKMYLSKTELRIRQLETTDLSHFIYEDFRINNKLFPSLNNVLSNLKSMFRHHGLYNIEEFNILHGDFFFANILIDRSCSIFKTIDPRGDFGGYGNYGDSRYDIAKLSHSIDGRYDFIINDKFTLSSGYRDFTYSVKSERIHDDIKNMFYSYYTSEQVKLFKLIQCVLFLSMIPLHSDAPQRQLVMLGTSMRLFDEISNGA